jgi:hypothetical protein
MTFRPNPSDVKLANRALSRLSQGPITSIEPPTPVGTASRECQRWYVPTVGRLLELHHWNLATTRTTLTEVANTRDSEWTYAYQLPADCAFPVSLAPISGSGVTYYQGLAGLLAMWQGSPAFLKTGSILYSRFSGTLDYVSYDITEADFNATFENIVELTLAAAMCYAITKSRTREESLRQQATSAINIAIAQNLNAGRPRYGDGSSERDIVRGADSPMPWDWTPGTP